MIERGVFYERFGLYVLEVECLFSELMRGNFVKVGVVFKLVERIV